MDANELAMWVNKHWTQVTNLPESAKHEEGEFPDAVLQLIDNYGVDYLDFVDAWTELHG